MIDSIDLTALVTKNLSKPMRIGKGNRPLARPDHDSNRWVVLRPQPDFNHNHRQLHFNLSFTIWMS